MVKMFKIGVLLCLFALALSEADDNTATIYDYFTGWPVEAERLEYYKAQGIVDTCTIPIKPCDANEWKRLDGSCNNLKRPGRGTYLEPMPRLLPPSFHEGYHSRKAKSGKDLVLPRVARTHLLKEGRSVHKDLTIAVPSYATTMFGDIGSVHDTDNILIYRPYSCDPEYKDDYWSTPNIIPEDDPIHRFSGIRCMNLTRPQYHQTLNCTDDPVPSPLAKATSAIDLSNIYNWYNNESATIRAWKGGLLITEEEDGKTWPPSGPLGYCPLNQGDETRCYGYNLNALLPINIFVTINYRFHNYIASKLAAVNPCWDDDRLYYTARDINIAVAQRIYMDEWLSTLIGRENAIKSGVVSGKPGYRDIYDDTLFPAVTLEFSYVMRWFHLLQQGMAKKYNTDGEVIDEISAIDLTFRTGYLCKNNNMASLTAALHRQPSSHPDSIDYEMCERGFSTLQQASDIPASDLHKGRLFGLPPYVDYLNYFFGVNVTSFEEMEEFIPKEKLYLIQEIFEDVSDIDLLVEQLTEVRKSTLSMVLCSVGDDVTKIQPNAFRSIGPGNELTSCDDISHIDFSVMADSTCTYSK